jgi:hypothetical protein
MSPADLEAAFSRFAFWPGWEFSVYLDKHLGPMVFIKAAVPDGYDFSRVADLGIRSRIPPGTMRGPRELGEWLLWRLEEVFIHEVREGLRYDGELVDDPHAGD